MSKRKSLSSAATTKTLVDVARRCVLCYGLHRDLSLKKGQIAHIDQDSSNPSESNLAFLCFDHHDEFDSHTSQSKNFTAAEILIYKQFLIEAIEREDHAGSSKEKHDSNAEIKTHDRKIFVLQDSLLSEEQLESFVERLGSDHSYKSERIEQIREFIRFSSKVGNQFLDSTLVSKMSNLLRDMTAVANFIAQHFFWYPDKQNGHNIQFCLYPALNVDRDGDGTEEQMQKYDRKAEELSHLLSSVENSYMDYRKQIKLNLYL